ncbi:MAG: aminotransferase class I/II-fold pyridoxal phosphate-dependent enzyme [Actinomycetota bacterium]|nr:aminotransferase class I/II-fold pyridoxal phosphate-dependent enzyme [Actinomycetota bacterium]
MPSLAPHIPGVPGSGIRRITHLAGQLDGVRMLAIGEPDVPVAPHIAAAAKAAWDRDDTDYGPNGGIPELRAAIAEKLARDNGLSVDLEQIWVTVGATQALHQAMTLLLGPGDEILIPDPGYTTFTMTPSMLGARPVPYSLSPERGFLPDIDELDRLVTAHTRVLLVNSPSNPLGVMFGEEVLRELLAFARRHDLWVISDEVYEYFTYADRHISPAALDADDRVFSVYSLSKTYAMTGIRTGYLVTPPGFAEILRTVQEGSISCASTPAQHAAIAAIRGDQSPVAEAREHYRANLATATALLDSRGIRYLTPAGAFYLWIDMSFASGGDVDAWAERFLLTERVAIAPGSAFGRGGEGWIRVSAASARRDLLAGLTALPAPGTQNDSATQHEKVAS